MSSSGPLPITLEVVTERAQWRQFITLPHRLYADDPAWVAPLNFEQRQRFSPANHFFEHARWRAWLAFRGTVVVGRITAQIDEMHLRQHADGTGYFGMLECEDDPAVFSALLEAAANWLREEGMTRVRGPLNLHINEEVGLLVDGFSTPPFVLMGHARPYYGAGIETQGYRGARDLLAYHIRPDFEPPRVMTKLAERVSGRVTVRPMRRKQLGEDAAIMLDIFNDAWQNNWNFVPFTRQEFAAIGKELLMIVPDDFIQIATIDGQDAAFIVLLPNINEIIADLNGRLLPFGWAKLLWRLKVRSPKSGRVPLMGVRQKYQNTRFGPALAFMTIKGVIDAGLAMGLERVEMSWILDHNHGVRNIIESLGGDITKRYCMYQKEL